MAKGGAKAKKERNEKLIAKFQQITAGTWIFHLLVRVIWFWDSMNFWTITGFLGISAVLYLCLQTVTSYAKPIFNDKGELEDVADLSASDKGFTEYMVDIMYITWAVCALTCFSDKFWYLYLSIPAYAAWKIWGLFSAYKTNQKMDQMKQAILENDPAYQKKMAKKQNRVVYKH